MIAISRQQHVIYVMIIDEEKTIKTTEHNAGGGKGKPPYQHTLWRRGETASTTQHTRAARQLSAYQWLP